MTNPFELLTLYAAEYYNKASSASASTHKSIVYALGTTILASFLYKTLLQYKQATTPSQRPYNFLYTISLPFQYLYYKFVLRRNPSDRAAVTAPTPTPALAVLFEDKYFNEYDEWVASLENTAAAAAAAAATIIAEDEEHKKECLENMYYSTVREKINDFYGDVIMCYDHATFSFAYYARTGNIPYKYLETISRKYMIETNAPREIHVDIREEYKKAKERTQANTDPAADKEHSHSTTINVDTQQQEEEEEKEQDVFVNLKSYNTASNLNLHTTTNDTKEKTHKFVSEHTETAPTNNNGNTADKILREKANRYSYRGKIDDFAQHHKTFLAERRKTATDTDTDTDTATDQATDTATTTGLSSEASVDGGRNPPATATTTGLSSEASVDGGRNPPSVDGGRNPPSVDGGRNPQRNPPRNPQSINYADFKKQMKTRSAL